MRARYAPVIAVFVLAVVLRLVPELIAYPYPIGYDVVNYYIPYVEQFDLGRLPPSDFPLYVLMLHIVHSTTGIASQVVVSAAGALTFGFFGSAAYAVGRRLLKLHDRRTLVLVAFVLLQIAVLRTAWDLQRDLLALACLLTIVAAVPLRHGKAATAGLLALCCVTVALDRMVAVLLLSSLGAGALFRRDKRLFLLAGASGVMLLILLLPHIQAPATPATPPAVQADVQRAPVLNFLVLFALVAGALVAPAVLGIRKSKESLLAGPVALAGLGAATCLLPSAPALFVPDRWMVLFGIFASILAGYYLASRLEGIRGIVAAGSVLGICAVVAIAYMAMPYDSPFFVFALSKPYVQDYVPPTMQFSALDVKDTPILLRAIGEVNAGTAQDAIVVGSKHWRGFMALRLEGQRTYKFSSDPEQLARAYSHLGYSAYIFEPDQGGNSFRFVKIEDLPRK